MQLFGSFNSPFVRKVRAAIAELGVEDKVSFEIVNPRDPQGPLAGLNPLRKIPTLLLDDGKPLFESSLICQYLADKFDQDGHLLPRGEERWKVLTGEALADGLLEAGVLVRQEYQRPENERSPAWVKAQNGRVDRALERFAGPEMPQDGKADLAAITLGCALHWLSFRFPDNPWRERHPNLASWSDAFAGRPSMRTTAPVPD